MMLKIPHIHLMKLNLLKQNKNVRTFSHSYIEYLLLVKLNTNQTINSGYQPININTTHFILFPKKNCVPFSNLYNAKLNSYPPILSRKFSTSQSNNRTLGNNNATKTKAYKHRSTLYYIIAVGILSVGLSYAAVPLYRIFCQAYSYGGTTQQEQIKSSKLESMVSIEDREIVIRFNADLAASLNWNFRPQQTTVKVRPGETALAFYSARNPTDKQVIGISTYNVIPFEAGQYFNKIQCFCFEEQMLNPNEEVSMPVFFYIDPEFAEDPKMERVREITLSYTFFEVSDGMKLPLPGFAVK